MKRTYNLAPIGNLTSHITTLPPLLLVLFTGLKRYMGARFICQRIWLFLTCFWPVSDPFLTCFWPLYVTTLCEQHVWAAWMSTLCVSTLCMTTLCEHSMYDHSMWALYVWTMWDHSMCEHSMWEHSICEHSMCEHSMYEHFMWDHSMWAVCMSTLCVSTLCMSLLYGTTLCDHVSRMCEHSMYERGHKNTQKYHYNKTTTKTPPQKDHISTHYWAKSFSGRKYHHTTKTPPHHH